MRKICNARIESVSLSIADHGVLSGWLYLDYGGSGQGFGGHSLYALARGFDGNIGNHCGHFITRCCQIAGVDKWEDLKGKTIRADADHGKVHGIGHILKDDWFYPSEDWKTE